MLSSDLTGLGLPWPIANRLANGGTGPVSIAATGASATTAAKLLAEQYISYINTGTATSGILLPTPTPTAGADGPLIYDDYVVHNGTAGNILIYPPSGVTMNVGGTAYTNAAPLTLATLKTLSFYTGPTSTQWFGLSG